jgi:hypothetical protein
MAAITTNSRTNIESWRASRPIAFILAAWR